MAAWACAPDTSGSGHKVVCMLWLSATEGGDRPQTDPCKPEEPRATLHVLGSHSQPIEQGS